MSVTAESVAPSALPRSPRFQSWALGAGLRELTGPKDTVDNAFTSLTTFKLPKYFTLKPTLYQNDEELFYTSLKEWGSHNTDFVQDKGDPHKLKNLSMALYSEYWSITNAVEEEACELSQRRGVDGLIQLAFSRRQGASHKVRFEQSVQVCESTWSEIRVGGKAIADTVVVMPIPAEKMDAITVALDQVMTSNDYEEIFLRLFWTTSITLPNTLIIFLGEFKKVRGNRNQNQLLLDFRTAQSQRLALGLPDAIIWGSTCAMGNFKVYSSEWNEDHTVIHWRLHHTWNLTIPIDFLRCYTFLCMLSNELKSVQDAINALDPSEVAQSSQMTPWRAPTLLQPQPSNKRPRNEAQPGAGPSGQGLVGESDDADVLDMEELVEESDGEIESDTESSEEIDMARRGGGAKDMPMLLKEGHSGLVYDQLHDLSADPDWWRSYFEV